MPITARKWELANAADILAWMEISGAKERLLSDICLAVKRCVLTTNRAEPSFRHEILKQYPEALANCDDIDFNDRAQAVAYLALHMADRYSRTWLVLEELLTAGKLPLGKSGNFSVLDVGSGPGPGVFAVRHFYAALAHYTKLHDSELKVEVVGRIGIVERSYGMAGVMHHFAEVLLMIERGDDTRDKNPCFEELITSSISFHSGHQDFENFNLEDMRVAPRYWITANEETPTDEQEKKHAASKHTPSAYSLILMINFLTTKQMVRQFDSVIDKLMHRGLTPGGVIMCLGARKEGEGKYRRIYDTLDQKAFSANLIKMGLASDSLRTDSPQYVPEMLAALSHEIWRHLAADNDTAFVEASLKKMGCEDIFNADIAFDLPYFSAHVYRKGM